MARIKSFNTLREGDIIYFVEYVKDELTGKKWYTYYKKKISFVTFPGTGYMTVNFKGYPTITLNDDVAKLNSAKTNKTNYYGRIIYGKFMTTNERLFLDSITKCIRNMFSKMSENIFKSESTNIIRKSGIN